MKNLIIAIAMMTGVAFYGNSGDIKVSDDASASKTTKKHQVGKSSLPKDARQYMKENFPANGFTYAMRINNGSGEAIYEVGIAMDGKLSILEFDERGETLSERMTNK